MFKKSGKTQKKDALKQEPLLQAGESAHNELLDLLIEKLLFGALVIVVLGAVTWSLWVAWWRQKAVHPGFMTALTLAVAIVGAVKVPSAWRQAQNLRLGVRGERAGGQRLEGLRTKGYRIYHDIVEPGYNIDHVVIGPGGVFVIETKTIRKPARGNASIQYDGDRVLIDGRESDRNPVFRVRACADRIGDILEEGTGRRLKIRPVVLYPDWWVEKQPKGETDSRQFATQGYYGSWVVELYSPICLHSTLGHVTPKDKPEGRKRALFAERDRKLAEARERRRVARQAARAAVA
ncbi:MAG: nuclease-related domain-containing protein [Planctomycetota bacterium]